MNGGVFKSVDGGNHWTEIETGRAVISVCHLAIDPRSSRTLYAGYRDFSGSQDRIKYGSGVLKTTNGGESWKKADNGLTDNPLNDLAIDPVSPQRLYAAAVDGGVFRSTDGGENWINVNLNLAALTGNTGSNFIYTLAIDRASPPTLYAGTRGGLLKSTDSGKNWAVIPSIPGGIQVHSVAIDPALSQHIYAGTDDGLLKSTDGGKSWEETDWNYGKEVTAIDSSGKEIRLTLKLIGVEALAIDPSEPQTFYTGAVGCGMFKSTNGGRNWMESGNRPNCTFVFSLSLDPASPQTLYAGTDAGVFKSTDAGKSWTGSGNGLPADGDVLSLAIVPEAPQTVFAVLGPGYKRIDNKSVRTSDGGIFKSMDAGHNWTQMDIDLPCGTDQAIAVDPAARTIYIGTSCGLFRR